MASAPREMPSTLAPVLNLINTVDIEDGTDKWADGTRALSRWLSDQHLVPTPVIADQKDLRLACDIRAGLRSLALMNNAGRADSEALARGALAFSQLPLIATISPPHSGAVALAPHQAQPVRAALATIVAGYAVAVATGDWKRIRICPAEDCAWAFWDSTPQASRRWCNMSVCGNRAKARAFAQRRTTAWS